MWIIAGNGRHKTFYRINKREYKNIEGVNVVKKKIFRKEGDKYFSERMFYITEQIEQLNEVLKDVGKMTLYTSKLRHVGYENLRVDTYKTHTDIMNRVDVLKTQLATIKERYEEFKKLI